MKPYEVALTAIGKMVGMMTGSSVMRNGDDVLIIQGLKASKKYRSVQVKYNAGSDLFDMTFTTKRSMKEEKVDGVFVDQLRDIFESKTGLYASL